MKESLNIDAPTTLNFIDGHGWNNATIFVITISSNATVIPSGFFQRFPKLNEVRISTGLKTIQEYDFKSSDALTILNLSKNELQVIPKGVFSKATKLAIIELQLNGLTTIEDYAFIGLNSLAKLRLENNSLTILKERTFAGAPNLDDINLQNNQIQSIEDGAFDLPKLKNLQLSHNSIRVLSDNVFVGAPNLGLIELKENGLSHIGQSFYGCERLTWLDLGNNQINDIDLQSFAKLPKLNYLWLKNSGFRFKENVTLAPDTAKSQLFRLDLSENGLNNSDVLLRLESSGYADLKVLSLENNNFTVIDELIELKQKFQYLYSLSLSGNFFDYNWIENAVQTLNVQGVTVSYPLRTKPTPRPRPYMSFIRC